jgi:hypothetical protein
MASHHVEVRRINNSRQIRANSAKSLQLTPEAAKAASPGCADNSAG